MHDESHNKCQIVTLHCYFINSLLHFLPLTVLTSNDLEQTFMVIIFCTAESFIDVKYAVILNAETINIEMTVKGLRSPNIISNRAN